MAKNCICVLHDKVADNYSAPIAFANESTAIRYLANIAKKDDNAKDYDLYKIADYESDTAVLKACDKVLVARGESYVSA